MIPCIFLRDEKYIVVYNEWTYIEKQEAVGTDIRYCEVFIFLYYFNLLFYFFFEYIYSQP